MSIRLALMGSLLAAGAVAQAQTVWRCGADGRSYGDSPCPEGRMVVVADARSPAEVAQASEVLARDQRLAQQLVAERREREREALARGSGLAAIGASEAIRPASKPKATKEWLLRPQAKHRRAAGAETSRATARGSRRTPG